MAINKETIISVFNEKLTLMQWLKTINKALEDAVLTGVEVRQKGNATYSFVITFEDGTELESNEFVLAQGESINGATIINGHLYLSLTNGTELDAGNVKPVTSFSINDAQHLIVNYGDGTSQDLGAIFQGNINIDGNFTANSIIENMSGYSATKYDGTHYNFENVYASVVKTGNKITFVVAGDITRLDTSETNILITTFTIPTSIANKLNVTSLGYGILSTYKVLASISSTSNVQIDASVTKYDTNKIRFNLFGLNSVLIENQTYYLRMEVTFLLSDNMVV